MTRPRATRRLTTGLVLAAYLCAVVGLPLPTLAAREDRSSSTCACGHTGNGCCCTQGPARAACCQRGAAPACKKCEAAAGRTTWTLHWSSPKCPCESKLWVLYGSVLPPPAAPGWNPHLRVVACLSDRPSAPKVLPWSPPVPPPRLPA